MPRWVAAGLVLLISSWPIRACIRRPALRLRRTHVDRGESERPMDSARCHVGSRRDWCCSYQAGRFGLVYVDRLSAFGGHMWTEANLNGQWIPLDATLGRGGIGAAHIKLADSSLYTSTGSPPSADTCGPRRI